MVTFDIEIKRRVDKYSMSTRPKFVNAFIFLPNPKPIRLGKSCRRDTTIMASIKLRSAQLGDAAGMADTHYRALDRYHEFYGAFFVLDPRDILAKSTPVALKKPENIILVAVDEESNDVVGIVKYTIEAEKTASTVTVDDPASVPSGPSLTAVKEHLTELWTEFGKRRDEMDECYEKAADGKRHVCRFCPSLFH